MKNNLGLFSLLGSSLIPTAAAQFVDWVEDQVNTTICVWSELRAALIRDKLYLDGGSIWWMPELADGRFGALVDDKNPRSLILTYDLGTPVDSETNVTGLFLNNTLSKAIGGSGNGNGVAPNFNDGALLANDAQFFLYGGSVYANNVEYELPDGDEIMVYQAFSYGPEKSGWTSSVIPDTLPEKVNRYIAFGGSANAPSENKAWYFSGLRTPTVGDIIRHGGDNGSSVARNISNYLIEVDMEVQFSEKWTNKTLPDYVQGRANPEVVWVPVGEQGILVVLGGVVYPEWVSADHHSEDQEASEKESPRFMQEIDIYDIANDEWYQQTTEKGPDARTRGCAVLATASDYSSFNIYYYGGYDGLHADDDFYDDVWVLSMPSFTWTRLHNGTSIHARVGHKCFTPYPDQMMVVGGETPLKGFGMSCLDKGPLIFFNLTSGTWMEKYHPNEFSDYGVPSKVVKAIGGDASGGATVTTPAASGWATEALEELFAVPYDTAKLTSWWPYTMEETPTERPELPGNSNDNGGGGGGLPSWVAPVLGVVLGLMVLTGALVVFILWRRRKIFQRRGASDDSTEDAGKRILLWMRGQPLSQQPTEKAPTVTTTEETPSSPEMRTVSVTQAPQPSPPPPVTIPQLHETAGTPIAELDDTSAPAELSENGLTPTEIIQRHTHFGKPKSLSDPSYSSFSGRGAEVNSTISGSSAGAGSAPASQDESRPDSPSLPIVPHMEFGNMLSLSETLAGVTTTAAEGNSSRPAAGPRRESDLTSDPLVSPPVSPPTGDDFPGDDYITARSGLVSPIKRSVFHENEEDMGKHQ